MSTSGYLCIHSNSLTEVVSNRKSKHAITKSNLTLALLSCFILWEKSDLYVTLVLIFLEIKRRKMKVLICGNLIKRVNLKWHSLVRKNSSVLHIKAKFLLSQWYILLAANTMLWSYFYGTSKDAQIEIHREKILKSEV